jgi:hypothetical protein
MSPSQHWNFLEAPTRDGTSIIVMKCYWLNGREREKERKKERENEST